MEKWKKGIIYLILLCMVFTGIPWNTITTAFAQTNTGIQSVTLGETMKWNQAYHYEKDFIKDDFNGIKALHGSISNITASDEGVQISVSKDTGLIDSQEEYMVADGTFEATVIPKDSVSGVGLLMRATDNKNRVFVGTKNGGNEWFWEYSNNGTNRKGNVHSSQETLIVGEEAHIKVELIGKKVSLWVNDTLIFSEEMSGNSPKITEGFFGVAKSSSEGTIVIKDYKVSEYKELLLGDSSGITRAQWLHNLAIMFDMNVDDDILPDNYFADLSEDSEYYKDILLNAEFGVIDVPAGENVYPNEPATREFIAHTLNFCLGFQLEGERTYTFNDLTNVDYKDDVQIALNRKWFKVVNGKFNPDTTVTKDELKNVIDDTSQVLAESVIDENYESTYDFADEVIVVPEYLEIIKEESTITIKNTGISIAKGKKFAIYLNGIPNVYVADLVKKENRDLIITYSDVDIDEGFDNIDAQGVVALDLSQVELADGVEVIFMDGEKEQSFPSTRALIDTYGADTLTFKDIYLKKSFDLGGGTSVSMNVTIKHPKVHYDVTALKGHANVYLTGNAEVTYSVQGDISKATGINDIKIFQVGIPGIGGLEVSIKCNLSGKISGTQTYDLSIGVSYDKNEGIRVTRNFKAKSFTISIRATASVAVNIKLGVTDLPIIDAYIYGEVGGIANLSIDIYTDGSKPTQCTHFATHLYAKVGVNCSIEFLGFKPDPFDETYEIYNQSNSPIREVYHYEDGIQVVKCTRGKAYSYLTNRNSKYSSSGWYDGTAVYAYDANGNPIPLYTYTLDSNNNATITGYNGYASSLTIPEKLDGHTVIGIEQKAFKENKRIVSISLADTITKIGDQAFYDCINLSTIELSDNLKMIGAEAFRHCTSLRYVQLTDKIDTIEENVFADCFNLGSVYIPKSVSEGAVTYITNSLFDYAQGIFVGCENLNNVTFEEGTTWIHAGMFAGSGIKTIEIPDTVTGMGEYAFACCNQLQEIIFSDSFTKIEQYAFWKCDSLETVVFSNNINDIGQYAFADCVNLKNIYIPVKMSEGAITYRYGFGSANGIFSGCSSLENVEFEEGTTVIHGGLFAGSGLKQIELPETITAIGPYAFAFCSNLTNVKFNDLLTTIDEYAFWHCSSLEKAIIPKQVNSISKLAFEYCTSLKEVYIPKKLNEGFITCMVDTLNGNIEGIFNGCSSLEKVTIEEGATYIHSGLLAGSGIKEYVVPDTVTAINDYVFANCTQLEKIVLQENVTSLGKYTFFNCKNLKEIDLPKSLQTIDYNCFNRCVLLEHIEIPDSCNTLGRGAFLDAESLVSVKLPKNTLMYINASTFKNCVKLEKIEIPESITAIGDSAFENCVSLGAVTLSSNLEEIGTSVFRNCDSFEKIEIPNSVVSIGGNTFYDCDSLKEVLLSNGVSSIESSLFEHCDVLETIVLPYGITKINSTAFKNCVALSKITIPRSVSEIKVNAFSYLDKITIYGVSESYAETFAKENNIKFASYVKNASEMKLEKERITLLTGDSFRLRLSVQPFDFTDEVVWKTSNADIVTVDQVGNISAKGIGTTVIKVSVGNMSQLCEVTVVQPVTKVYISKSNILMRVPESVQLTASIVPDNAFNKELLWESSDPSIVSVDQSGKITAHKKGEAKVTVTAKDGSGKQDSCSVEVNGMLYTVQNVNTFESQHDYENNCNDKWVYTVENANRLTVFFDEKTYVEDGFDYIYIYDRYDQRIGKYTGDELAGKSISIQSDMVQIQLISDNGGNEWGFRVSKIQVNDDEIIIPDITPSPTPNPTPIPGDNRNPFTDVKKSDYYFEPVLWALENNVTAGLSETTFAPNADCTRGQVVTFLWRVAGCPEPSLKEATFKDVPIGTYYYKPILWAVENNISSGYNEYTFGPEDKVTRGQFVSLLWRMKGNPEPSSLETDFIDLPDYAYYYKAVLWAAENKVAAGFGEDTFAPDMSCTRGQVVSFLYRARNL